MVRLAESPQSALSPGAIRAHLAGTWQAAEDRMPRVTPLDQEVFGQGAVAVRNVTLALQPSGEGRLRIKTAVVGHSGRVYAPLLIEVTLHIDDAVTMTAGRIEPAVSVRSATAKALDDEVSRWNVAGARVALRLGALDSPRMTVQFDSKDGRDDFNATLTRHAER
jgi:hypothetical protein